ncbi:MAG: sensor histidine kinase [Bilifractor sp.]|jgi:signal transduction histidine kinase
MWVLFAVLSSVLLSSVIWQRIQYKKLEDEIGYISDRLETLPIAIENGFVLLPTDHSCIKKLGNTINALLQNFYEKKSEYAQSQKETAQVLTNISHDIRTPLTVLKGNSELLVTKSSDLSIPKTVQMMAVNIDHKADDLIKIINDYFTMAKISSGDIPLEKKKENISNICRDTILEYYDLLEKQQFNVDIQIPDAPIYAITDKNALQRILKNLIDNAIQHGGDGQYIALRLLSAEDSTIIEVEDHGKGISAEQQKLIFTRNYTTTRKSSGNGLGLAIAKNLSEKLGAELQVHSIQNERTTFAVILKS